MSSRGIAAVCDVRPSSMQSDSTALTAADYRNIQDGDLPVMLVDDWNEVDEAALLRFKQSIETSTFNTRKLTLDYWARAFRAAAESR